jgi:hypothetical protein
MYRLTSDGLRFAKEKLATVSERVPTRRPAIIEGRAQ